jgi:membrane protease YdiL (CAAX protease family)
MDQTESTSGSKRTIGEGRGCGCLLTIAVIIVWFVGKSIIEVAFIIGAGKSYNEYLMPLSILDFLFTFGIVWAFWKLIRVKDPLGELGMRPAKGASLQFIWGLLLGAAGVGVAVLMIEIGGGVVLQKGQPAYPESADMGERMWPVAILIFLLYAFNEEIIMRGFLYPFIKRSFGFTFALFLSTLVFSLLHLFNAGFDVIPFIDIFLAGIFLALLRELTGNLWFAGGAHFAWNFTLAALGLPVSGIVMLLHPQPFHLEVSGPDWLTGGIFGPEGGLSGIAADCFLIAITAWLLYLKSRRSRADTDDGIHAMEEHQSIENINQ